MSAATINWTLLGIIVLQATLMAWMVHDSNKSFTALSDQVGRLIDMLHEIIELDDDAEAETNNSGDRK